MFSENGFICWWNYTILALCLKNIGQLNLIYYLNKNLPGLSHYEIVQTPQGSHLKFIQRHVEAVFFPDQYTLFRSLQVLIFPRESTWKKFTAPEGVGLYFQLLKKLLLLTAPPSLRAVVRRRGCHPALQWLPVQCYSQDFVDKAQLTLPQLSAKNVVFVSRLLGEMCWLRDCLVTGESWT